MKVKLNGWRRIGIVIVIIWFVSHGVWALVHYNNSVESMKPKVVSSGNYSGAGMTSKDLDAYLGLDKIGKTLLTVDEAAYQRSQEAYFDLWRTRCILAITIPLLLWVSIEALVIAYCWISHGFSSEKSQATKNESNNS